MASIGVRDPIAKRVPSCQTAASGGRTDRCGSIESREVESVCSHRIQVRPLTDGVAIEPNIAPTEVIGHDENDVRFGVRVVSANSEEQPKDVNPHHFRRPWG